MMNERLLLPKRVITLKDQLFLLRSIISIIILSACSARPTQPIIQKEIEFDGSIIQAQGDVLTADELFEKGVQAFESQKFALCETHLTRYLKNFPQGGYRYYTHYNLGLCYEFQHQYKLAAEQFEAYVLLAQQQNLTSDRIDGEVRQGYNLVYSGQGEKAIPLYEKLLLIGDTGDVHNPAPLTPTVGVPAAPVFNIAT